MLQPAVPSLVRFVRQSGHHGDCAIAMLAMFAGTLYEDALLACGRVNPHVLDTGLTWPQICRVARRLGVRCRVARRYDPDEATGILHVSPVALGVQRPVEHVVLLWAGRVVDGNGELWLELASYLRHYGYEAKALLVAEES